MNGGRGLHFDLRNSYRHRRRITEYAIRGTDTLPDGIRNIAVGCPRSTAVAMSRAFNLGDSGLISGGGGGGGASKTGFWSGVCQTAANVAMDGNSLALAFESCNAAWRIDIPCSGSALTGAKTAYNNSPAAKYQNKEPTTNNIVFKRRTCITNKMFPYHCQKYYLYF